jgi:hypothetical protein
MGRSDLTKSGTVGEETITLATSPRFDKDIQKVETNLLGKT